MQALKTNAEDQSESSLISIQESKSEFRKAVTITVNLEHQIPIYKLYLVLDHVI